MESNYQLMSSGYKQIPLFSPKEDLLKVSVNELRPTQMCIGMAEVINRKKDFEKGETDERLKYLKTKPVPLVKNASNGFWMLDRHHRLRALLEIDPDAKAYGYIVHSLDTHKECEVLKFLHNQGWLHLYNNKGTGPHPVDSLPKNLLELQDDPYRSLIWQLKQEGILKPQPHIPFNEFRWASWLRSRALPPFNSNNLKPALAIARNFIYSKPSYEITN